MSCYRCADKFRLFKKEIGCGNCGFSFCSKCCDNRINVPKKDNKLLNVCQKCFDLIKNENEKKIPLLNKDQSPPKNFFKMVESNNLKFNQSNPDKDIENRLRNLKEKPKTPVPDTEELESRLLKLQGKNESYNKLSNLPGKEVIKTPEDLISKLTEEVKIDQTYEEYEKRELEKLENRLKNLKADSILENENKNLNEPKQEGDVSALPRKVSDPNDDIMRKFLQEAEVSYKKRQDSDQDEWCCLCNNDASIKCIDCEDDLYCKRCYKQTHSTGEYKLHKKTDIN